MSSRRWQQQRDANERELVRVARKVGAWMIRSDAPADWWCGWRGRWYPVEIKTATGKLTAAQQKFHDEATYRSMPVWIWRATDDVIRDLYRVP